MKCSSDNRQRQGSRWFIFHPYIAFLLSLCSFSYIGRRLRSGTEGERIIFFSFFLCNDDDDHLRVIFECQVYARPRRSLSYRHLYKAGYRCCSI